MRRFLKGKAEPLALAEIAVVYAARTLAAKFRMRLGIYGRLKRVLSGKRGCHWR